MRSLEKQLDRLSFFRIFTRFIQFSLQIIVKQKLSWNFMFSFSKTLQLIIKRSLHYRFKKHLIESTVVIWS